MKPLHTCTFLLALGGSGWAAAQTQPPPPPPPAAAERGPAPGMARPGPMEHGPGRPMPGHGGPGMRDHGMHFAPGVALTEVQQDRAFAIMHAQAPQRRELDKQVRAAHDALRALSTGPFDETRASSQAQALGRAVAAQELLHARTQAQLMALLTPDQRAQARQGRPPAPAQP